MVLECFDLPAGHSPGMAPDNTADLLARRSWCERYSGGDLPEEILAMIVEDLPSQAKLEAATPAGDTARWDHHVWRSQGGEVPSSSLRKRASSLVSAATHAIVIPALAAVAFIPSSLLIAGVILGAAAVTSLSLLGWSLRLKRKANRMGERRYEYPVDLLPQHMLVLYSVARRVSVSGTDAAWEDYWDAVDLVKQREALRLADPGNVVPEVAEAISHLDVEIIRVLGTYPKTTPATSEVAEPDMVSARVLAETVTAEVAARQALRE